MEEYFIIAFDESKRKFIRCYTTNANKIEAINDFEWHHTNCTVVNIIEL